MRNPTLIWLLLVIRFSKILYSTQRAYLLVYYHQRWDVPWPRKHTRGHILKSFALASKAQVLENCPVLGSRTALFFVPLKFCWKTPEILRKFCEDLLLLSSSGDRLKKNLKTFFFGERLCLCPWFLALASRRSFLGLGSFLCPWP